MKNWKNTLISPKTSVRRAIETIDKGSLQIALVVDKKGVLLGTVTDGDVRRGILKGVTLNDAVEEVMRREPVTAQADEKRKDVLAIMRKRQVHQLPLLDEAGRVIGMEVLDELLSTSERQNWVVLMAGGFGNRLKPLTESMPKPLIPVGTKPILETILENFIEYGFKKFFVSVYYKDHMIKEHFGDGRRFGCRIEYLSEKEKLGTAGALGLLPEKPKLPFIVMNGDLLTKVNFNQLLDFHRENKVSATMCVREYDFQVPYGVVKMDGHHIQGVDEKPVHRFFVNAGIYALEPETVALVPKGKAFDMPQLFEALVKKGKKTAAFPVREYWIDIGRLADLERAKGEYTEVFQ